jgi:beta-xylosidase
VEGPYLPTDKPFICPDPTGRGSFVNASVPSPGAGGAIDASGFRDIDGDRYVVFKIDGNSLAGGGPCGNGGTDRKPTPLMLIKVAADGITPQGRPVQILDRLDIDGPLIEAPSITRLEDGSYALLFSSNCWNTKNYDVAWARARTISGPYIRQPALLLSGMASLEAPGGASVSSDGNHMVFHANHGAGRALFSTTLGGPGSIVRLGR